MPAHSSRGELEHPVRGLDDAADRGLGEPGGAKHAHQIGGVVHAELIEAAAAPEGSEMVVDGVGVDGLRSFVGVVVGYGRLPVVVFCQGV